MRSLFGKVFRLCLVVILLSLFAVAPVAASPGLKPAAAPPELPITLTAFLQWLVGGGGSIMAVSWLLERMRWFQALTPDAKDYTIFGLSAAVGCAALAVVMYAPAAVLEAIAPFFLVVASIFVMVFIVKTFHGADRKHSS